MKVIDPVCGMTMEEKDAVATFAYQGKTYQFCSTSCKEKFEKNPEAYARGKAAGTAEQGAMKMSAPRPDEPHAHSDKAEWTCPMHPEIRQAGPVCPKCGMALEPVESGLIHRKPNGPAPCIPRSCATLRGAARSAAWRWNRKRSHLRKRKTPSSLT